MKTENLMEHVLNLVDQYECTNKVMMKNIVLSESHCTQTQSLLCDIEENFKDLYIRDQTRAHNLTSSNETLQELFQKFLKVIDQVVAIYLFP